MNPTGRLPHASNASAAVRCRLQRDCSLVRPREHDYDAQLRRGQSVNVGGPGQALETRHENAGQQPLMTW